ncbi:MAG: DUF4271 domain-containing protein [Bacteroidia bacterium]
MPTTNHDSLHTQQLLLLNAEQRISLYGAINNAKPKNGLAVNTATHTNNDGFFVGLLLAVSLLTYLLYTQRKRFNNILNAVIADRYFNQLVREENTLVQRVFLILTLIFALVLPLFLFQVINYYHWNTADIKGFGLYIVLLLILAIMYFIKIITASFLGYVFEMDELVKSHFYNVFLTNNLLGLVLLPIVALGAYSYQLPQSLLIHLGIGAIIISYTFRTLRSLYMNVGFKGGAVYHLFLYFCTLEILPLVVLFKLLKSIV